MRGILFNYELGMFDAVIEGRKTETRRMKQTYKKGEKLFLKEPYLLFDNSPNGIGIQYKYGNDIKAKFKNKLFMPANCARHFIEIVDVRKELLQGISEESAIAEGIEKGETGYLDYLSGIIKGNKVYYPYSNPINSYASLWEKINGKGSWNLNPEIVVYKLKLIKK